MRSRITITSALLLLAAAAGVRAQQPADSAASAGAAARPPLAGGADALRPAEVVTPPGGLTILRLPVDGSPRVALRLSVPVEEGPSEAGAARLLQLLALERARAAAAPLGAQVDGARTPWGVAYTVEGAAVDFDQLAYVLRQAVAEPDPDPVEFERARSQALEEAQRLQETAAGRITAILRQKSSPEHPLVEGTPAAVQALDPADLRAVWARSHRRDRMTLVVVGDVPRELILASFRGVGAPPGPEVAPSTSPAPTGGKPRPQVIRSWYGEAYAAGDLRDPRGLVAATLVGDRLRAETGGRTETRLEVWEVGSHRFLAVVGATYPGQRVDLAALVDRTLPQAETDADGATVEDAVAGVRANLLVGARTAAGLAALVGRYYDATGDPGGAAALVKGLDSLDPTAMRAFLKELEAGTPVRAELKP